VGAIITLALNFLLIPTMSYYGSAIATIALMKHDVYFLLLKYYPIPYDLKENRGYLSLSILFQPYRFMVSERIMLESVY
jgi:O-antigen/teichoic acid export membrane protein